MVTTNTTQATVSVPVSGDGLDPNRVTVEMIRNNPRVRTMIDCADRYLAAIGYTDHGFGHVSRVAVRAQKILRDLGMPQREVELAGIAAYLHDIGNMVHRQGHAHHSALLSIALLQELGMPLEEIAIVAGAIANHHEDCGEPVSNVSAALILADKSDVLRSRVRNPKMISFDIHDRVNYAAERSEIIVEKDRHLITLKLKIDTSISQVIDYFEIFMTRMAMSRKGANYLNCDFRLIINDVQLA
ncbi:MAG: HD domain-containing protein [Candidatus Sumerlaeaceae bacterium]|nr:HD domain-containing protein [Candidatus Sumerlaeaceae bacterium]